MSEKDRGPRGPGNRPIQLKYTVAQPPAGDPKLPAYRLERIRQGAVLRVRKINEKLIGQRKLAAEKLARILAAIERSEDRDSVRAAQKVVDGEKYVKQVCALVNKTDEVLCKIHIILEIFKKPYPHTNAEDGLPVLTQKNLELMDFNLDLAMTQLAGIGDSERIGIIEDLQVFAPDHEMLVNLERLNGNMANFGSRHTRDVIAIMDTLNSYLDSVIKGTNLGIVFGVVSTRQQMKIFREVADLLTVQLGVDEEIGLEAQPADIQNWNDLLHVIEFTIASFAVKMTEVYEPNAIFLLSIIEVRSLQNLVRRMQRNVDDLTAQLESANTQADRTLTQRIGTSVVSILRRGPSTGKASVQTISEKTQNLADAKKTLEQFRKILQLRTKLDR